MLEVEEVEKEEKQFKILINMKEEIVDISSFFKIIVDRLLYIFLVLALT